MRILFICLMLLSFGCKSQKNTRNIKEIQKLSEEIGKTKYEISLLILYPNLKLDRSKIDSVYNKLN